MVERVTLAGRAAEMTPTHMAGRAMCWSPRAKALRYGLIAEGGHPAELDGEQVDHVVFEPEHGDREGEDGENHRGPVDPGVLLPGGQNPERDGHGYGQEQGEEAYRERGLEAAHNLVCHRLFRRRRGAQISPQSIGQPDVELLVYGLVQPQVRPAYQQWSRVCLSHRRV